MSNVHICTRFCLLLAVLVWPLGCSDDVASDQGADAAHTGGTSDAVGADAAADLAPETPTLPTELEPGWNVIRPGGDTTCSRGGEYAFAVRPGTVNKVVIDFMGGGACWDDLTCSIAGSIFNETVDSIDDWVASDFDGVYDQDRADNPFAGWYHVFIPYCTGDIHWGDATTTYGAGANEFTIHHRGAVNARAVLDWVYERFSAPETIFVTGCSAGAYGSVGWTPYLIEHYPDAAVYQMGDSGVGIITDNFFRDSFPSWNATELLPDWIPDLDPDENDIFALTLADLYGRAANYYPDYTFTQYTTAFDDNQTFYFQAMGGGDQRAWSQRMYASIEDAESQASNFYSFIAPGEQHCILPFANFYTMEADGQLLRDWVGDMIAGQPIESHRCQDCDPPGEE